MKSMTCVGLLVLVGWMMLSGTSAQAAGNQDTWTAVEQQLANKPPPEPATTGGEGKPVQSPEAMRQQMGAMSPIGEMMGHMMKSMAQAMADPVVAGSYATFMRNYYLALVEQGFSKDEALNIVKATGLPSLGQRN